MKLSDPTFFAPGPPLRFFSEVKSIRRPLLPPTLAVAEAPTAPALAPTLAEAP